MTDILSGPERLDDLQRGGLKLIQNPELFCFGMDAVLLSAYAHANEGEQVLDLCTGNGIVMVLMSDRTRASHLTGLEINGQSCDLARRSIALNHLEGRLSVKQGDVRQIRELFTQDSFDAVTCNPPYMIGGHGRTGTNDAKTIARHEVLCCFEDVAKAALWTLKQKGRFYLVHRPFRLAEIIRTLSKYHLEPKRMQLVYPYADREPNMVLLEAVKGGRLGMLVEKPLIVYEKNGDYTDQVTDIYERKTISLRDADR